MGGRKIYHFSFRGDRTGKWLGTPELKEDSFERREPRSSG